MAKSKTPEVLPKIMKNGGKLAKAVNPLAVVTEFLDTIKVWQEEESRRAAIAAKRDVLVRAIESEKELLLRYFEYRFEERKESLKRLYAQLGKSVTKNDHKAMEIALDGILGIIRENPIKDINEFRMQMADPKFQIEF